MDTPDTRSLPENAYRPLAPGETYQPVVPASVSPPQASPRALIWGLLFCALFTVASAYSGLKVGQVMEAAIPISILTIGLARLYRRQTHLLENVIITGVGGMSGSVVAGAIFTLPALYMLKLDPHPVQTTFICLAGGALGILFLIPLRRYFVRENHGEYPYPEATAITEVLITGEKGGSQAKLLLQATGIAAVYDFIATTFHVWKENIDLLFIPVVKSLHDKARMTMGFSAEAFILGLGYVMGLRSSMLLCAGGILSNIVLVPLIWYLGQHLHETIAPGAKHLADMNANEIFRGYVRYVGVGAIATAGIFGILKSLRVLIGSFSTAAKTFQAGSHGHAERTDRDLPVTALLIGIVVSALAAAIFFQTLGAGLLVVLIGLILALAFSFLFTSVAANAIATTARNPVSGMTMLTIIISSVVLLQFGLSGTTGMFFVMAIAGMVCTALSVSGQTITDLKTGYWLGSTPATQQWVKFLGLIVAAVFAAGTILVLNKTFQFGEAAPGDPRQVLAAPQAAIMKSLVEGFMSGRPVPYLLFGAGAALAVVLEMLRVPALTFALGMYLPLELNSPALVGGFLHHLVTTRSERLGPVAGKTMRERAIVIASGLMAGGALGGVAGAALRLKVDDPESAVQTPFYGIDSISQTLSLALFVGLCLYLWFGAKAGTKAASQTGKSH